MPTFSDDLSRVTAKVQEFFSSLGKSKVLEDVLVRVDSCDSVNEILSLFG